MVGVAKLPMNLQLFAEEDDRDFEKDSAYANMRREVEESKKNLDLATSEKEETDKFYKENYGDLGIENEKDYRKYLKEQQKGERNQELVKKIQDSDEPVKDIDDFIKESPLFKEMSEKLSRYEKETAVKQIEIKLKDELSELNSDYDLGLEELDQIPDLPNGDKILQLSQTKIPGTDEYMSLSDAYFVVNKKMILKDGKDAAKNEAIKALSSKNHLKPAGKQSTERTVQMPSETLKMYKQLNPGKTDAEYKDHWLKNR